jgi:vacuole morphology and inheritance protein 14
VYEKRKLGSLEVEQAAKREKGEKESDRRIRLAHLARLLAGRDFLGSSSPNARKGGLLGLAAVAIGVSSGPDALSVADSPDLVSALVPPVLSCFSDADMRVRYYACESLYNISKVARQGILAFFNEIFDGLCKLAADPDVNVQNGAGLLDRLVKDIVTEGGQVDVPRFIPLLRERMWVSHPACRRFLLGWIGTLHAVPGVDLLVYFPDFGAALFHMLRDPNRGIRQQADALLAALLQDVTRSLSDRTDEFLAALVKVLTEETMEASGSASARAALPWHTALVWIRALISAGQERLLVTATVTDLTAAIITSMGALEQLDAGVAGRGGAGAGDEDDEAAGAAGGDDDDEASGGGEGGAGGLGVGSTGGHGTSSPGASQRFRSSSSADSHQPHAEAASNGAGVVTSQQDDGDLTGEPLATLRDAIQTDGARANAALVQLVRHAPSLVIPCLPSLLTMLMRQFQPHRATPTRVAALRWVLLLQEVIPADSFDRDAIDSLHGVLLATLGDSSELVVRQDLEVLAKMATEPSHFDRLMRSLMELFRADPALLESRCSLALRQLASHLSPFALMRASARILAQEADRDFARVMMQALSLVLLASAEFAPVRDSLAHNQVAGTDSDGEALFAELYPAWCNAPTAAVALCLLCGRWNLAYQLLRRFAQVEVTVSLLVELDKLVQLIESPVFVELRLGLLEPAKNAGLYHALYAILMVLPQSRSYEILKERLSAVQVLRGLDAPPQVVKADSAAIETFLEVQRAHASHRAAARAAAAAAKR